MQAITGIHAENKLTENLLRRSYEQHQALYNIQPPLVRRSLDTQARILAGALVQGRGRLHFVLPSVVVKGTNTLVIPAGQREMVIGGWINHLANYSFKKELLAAEAVGFPEIVRG